MAKTKFLSRVLAVFMALTMLCSTGVFADYDSGLTTTDGTTAVTGVITATNTSLNGKISFWGADTVEEAKWFDVTEGLNLVVNGTTDAATGTITYVVAPVNVLNQVPLDVETMEAESVAIGTADIADGKFSLTIEADATKLVKDTTYELRLAYSKTEIADVTDASALVYQRYLKSFDWADADQKATRTITKEGIGDITIDIEGNPIRSAAIDAVSTDAQRLREKQSVTHIRTADLKTGDSFHYSSSSTMPEGFAWAGETDGKLYTTTTTRRSMFTEVGTELRGGVVLAQGVAEPQKYFGAAQQSGNPAYRFKATQSGTVYVLGVGTTLAQGWSTKDTSRVSTFYNYGSKNYLYTSKEITAADLGTETVALEDLQNYLVANTSLAVTTADAPGYYLGGSKSNLYKPTSVTYYAANTAYVTPEGYFQAPAANLDENGEWILKANKPYNMGVITNYGYTAGRGWLTQVRDFDHSYARTFEAGEWVEIPYTASVSESAKTCAVIQFDVPQPDIASVSYTPTLGTYHQYAGTGETKNLVTYDEQTAEFEAGTEEYVVTVPYGTAKIALNAISNGLATSEAMEIDLAGADTKTQTITIGDFDYNFTFKWDDTYPYISNVKYTMGYTRTFVQRANGGYIGYNTSVGNLSAGSPASAATSDALASAGDANLDITVDGEAISNNEYTTVFAIGREDNFNRTDMINYTVGGKVGWNSDEDWISFKASAAGKVYVQMSFANAKEDDFVWAEGAAAGWVKETNVTGSDSVLYSKTFAAGDTVNIPSQVVSAEELAFVNAKLEAAYPTTGTYQFKYFACDKSGYDAQLYYSEDGKDYAAEDKTWTAIPSGKDGTTLGGKAYKGIYYRRGASGLSVSYGYKTFVVVAFNQPFSLAGVTYSVDGGDAEAITFAEGETTKTIELPYDATAVSVAADKTGSGSVVVSDALDLTNAASGTITVTATPAGGEPVVYTINFVKGAPKITWESALALTGTAATPGSSSANKPIYSEGIYRLAEQSGEIDLSAEVVDLEVAYGTEAVVLNDEVTISLLDNNGAGTGTITVNGTEYTVNVSWKAFDAADMTEKSPLLYDLQYHDGAALVNGKFYNVVPTRLTLTEAADLVYGVGDVTNTQGTDDTTDDKVVYTEGEWFYRASHNAGNLQSVTETGAYLGRLHLEGESFASMVTTGDIANKYALDGATMLVASYKDTVDKNAERYSFKSAVDGYVIVGSASNNSALTAADGWSKLDGAQVVTSNITTSGNSTNYVFEGGTKQVATFSTAFDVLYIKKVSVGDEVVVAESAPYSQVPPLVIVAKADMIIEREVAPTLLSSLSYTTALAVTEPKESVAANGHSAKSLHANGFYQPTLVTEAQTVEVAEDATTVTVTVPYGSEIVNLAGVDTYEGAVAFDAINLINNNGAATVTKTVGEVEYTINVKWADYVAANDAAGNHVYDVKYRIRDLADATYYNAVPTKLVLTENRIAPQSVIGYKDAAGATVYAQAGAWYKSSLVAGAKSNLMVHNSGAQINRGRLTTYAFDGWVRNGFVTASGIPGAALAETATDAEVDAIAYNAFNGATTLVAHYLDYSALDTAAGANAAMAEHLSFRVAQDSIVYVSTTSSNIGTGWTQFADAGKLNLHNQTNNPIYVEGEDGTYTQFANNFITHEYSAGSNAFYRYAKAGDTVSITANKTTSNMGPVVLVRPIDFSGFEAPTMGEITYKIGSGEATAVEFDGTTATVEVPWGTTDAISLQAAITSGQGNLSVGDALTLSQETSEGAIAVTLTDVVGNEVASYTVNFVWGAAPQVDEITYSTARTLYKGAVATDAALTTDETAITVPWGTASVTVSYKMEGADAVALDAVNFVDGAATVEVPLPTGTVTYTFTYGDVPAGQYITGLTKVPNNWRDRMFVSYGDVDNAYTTGATKYATSGAVFFADDDEYSYRLPYGVAKKGYTAVIADAAANVGQPHMARTSFPYAFGDYPATEASNAWMTFTVAKAGTIYVSPASRDEAWAEGEALGWTEAPFTMVWGNQHRKVYQKKVAAGELVLMPNNKVTAEEVALYNETLTDVQYVQVTADQAAAIEAAAIEIHGEGYNTNSVVEGDWIAYYTDAYLAENPDTVTYAGAKMSKVDGKEIEIVHYIRANAAVTFVVADEFVDDAARAPQYTGATTLPADGEIELSAIPAAYAEKDDNEITFAIKEGSASYVTLEGTTLKSTDRNAWAEGDSVTLVITQGELSTEVSIAIADVEVNKYGTIEVYTAEGRGAVTAYLGDDPNAVVLETEGTIDELAGTIVTFSATPADGYKFLYWALVDTEGNVTTAYEYDPEFKMNVGYGLRIKAVFATDDPDVYTVTFKGWQGNIISQFKMDTLGDAESFLAPQAPSVYGYIFEGYESEAFADAFVEGASIPTTSIASDVTFVAKYVADENLAEYTVTVEGGTVDGEESKAFAYNTPVTVIANAAEEGMKFSHWTEGETIVSYDAEYDFYMASANRNLVAVYVEEKTNVVAAPVVTMTVTEVDMEAANGPIYGLFAERRVPEEYTVVENGIIWGTADDEADAENITWANKGVTTHPQGASTSKYQNNNGQYTVRLQMTANRQSKGDKWYSRTYLIYKDTDGSVKTMYSAPALVWEKAAVAE